MSNRQVARINAMDGDTYELVDEYARNELENHSQEIEQKAQELLSQMAQTEARIAAKYNTLNGTIGTFRTEMSEYKAEMVALLDDRIQVVEQWPANPKAGVIYAQVM